jgi:hypothetical protein
MFYLIFKAIKCHMEVGDAVTSRKTAEYTGVMTELGVATFTI